MKKIFLLLTVLILALAILPNVSRAALPAELEAKINAVKQEREDLQAEQRRLQAELDALNKQGQTLQGAVKSLDAVRKKLATDIRITQSKINSANLNIQALENSMTEKEKQIGAHEEAIASSLQELYTYDNRSMVVDLLVADELSQVWRDRGLLDDLNTKLQEEIVNLKEAKVALNKEKQQREKTKNELVGLSSELSGQKQVVDENQKAKSRLLAETKSKEAAYQKMLADNLAREKAFLDELFRLETELKVTLDPSLIPEAKKGIFSWPLDRVFITQRFGKTSGSARLYASGTHNGIDFRASMGTPVKAVLNGVIEGMGNTDEQRGCYSYGRWILVKHPNGLSTIYAHLSSSIVSKGQSVTTGQVIGYSGGTPGAFGSGYSTGPHLHLGLFASQGVEIRQFTQSNNCKQVFVPIAKGTEAYLDPMAYLPSY